ncbi:MAG TPA: trypsin-like peptidase domain-containing protein [Candidatus Saccharimonadales bacterium]|nr:trypsin-like peptidase domain-containing protein [Candidatus Saccharimonadales bacterium]
MNRFTIAMGGALVAGLMSAAPSAVALDSPALSMARQLNEAFIEVADKVSPSVVVIEVTEKPSADDSDEQGSFWGRRRRRGKTQHPRKMEGEGSGVVISEDGYILTNNHVVENAEKIEVRFQDGRLFVAGVKGVDPESDVAVIKIKAKGLTVAKLGDSDATRVGEFVVAIGAPFQLNYSVTVGHISAKGRSFPELGGDQDFIQTDASINPGNSGGPLVNLYGEVIALNAMIEGMHTGIGFAVPINLARRVSEHLIKDGSFARTWIGVEIDELGGNPDYMGLDKKFAPDAADGVVITGIRTDGPAAKSDLQPGDVVVSLDSKPIKTARQLKETISLLKPGHVLALGVVRVNQHLTVKVTTAPFPITGTIAQSAQSPKGDAGPPTFGLSVQAVTRDLADDYGVEPNAGVIVKEVEEDSPAEDRGIRTGDLITRVNGQRITSPKQFLEALRKADAKRGITVNLRSDKSSRFLILKDDDQ